MKFLYNIFPNPLSQQRFGNIILISGFALILSLLLTIVLTPAEQGYEYSIFGAFSIYFWVIFFTVIVMSICLIFSGLYDSRYSIYGVLILTLCYSIFLFLPYILGYIWFANYSYDLFAHLSWVQTINTTGNLPALFYPASHILLSVLIQLGMPLRFGVLFLPAFFAILYIAFMFLLGRILVKNSNRGIFALVVSIPLLFSFLQSSWIPFYFALSLIPIFLYLIQKMNGSSKLTEFNLLIMIISTATIFYHPMITFFIILILVLYEGYVILLRYTGQKEKNDEFSSNQNNFLILLAFTIIFFLFWYLSFSTFTNKIDNVVSALSNMGQSSDSSVFERSTEVIEKSNASLFLIVERFIKWYGPISLYIAGGILCLISIGWSFKKKRVIINEILFGCFFLGAIAFGFILTFSYLGLGELIRTISFTIVMATILIGFVISNRYDQSSSGKQKMLFSLILIGMIAFSAIFGMLNIYPSPWVGIASPSMTEMEHDGYNWFLENRDATSKLYINSASVYKYNLYAFANNPLIKDKQFVYSLELPGHFGYNKKSTIVKPLETQTGYVAVRKYDFIYYYAIPENLRAQRAIFTDSDHNQLGYDTGFEKLYSNREFEIWQLS